MATPPMPEIPFALTQKFTAGHHVKLQDDEVPTGASVFGSQNFIIDDDGKPRLRPGSEYLGRISPYTSACTGSATLRRRDGVKIPVVFSGSYSIYLHPDFNDWVALEYDLSAGSKWGACPSDVNTGTMNNLCMASQNDNFRIWNGATCMVDTATATTITAKGSTSLADRGFTSGGSLSVNGVYHTYSGISGNQFTGVSPDPSASVEWAGIAQRPVQYASAPKGNILLAAPNGRVLVMNVKPASGMAGGGQVYGSRIADPTYWTIPTAHIPGDPFVLNISEGGFNVTGAIQYERGFLIWKDNYIAQLTVSQDSNDLWNIRPFINYDEHNGGDEGSVSADAVFRLGNQVYFVSPTAAINTVERIANVNYPQSVPISDPIKSYLETLTMDAYINGCGWRGRAYFFFPTDGVTLVYDARYGCWMPPFIGMKVVSSFVMGGKLYGTLQDSPNIVELWTGDTDLKDESTVGFPINGEWRSGRMDFGSADRRKVFTRYYIEGEMESSGSATFEWAFNENGKVLSGTLQGTETAFFYEPATSEGFGESSFGELPFGGEPVDDSDLLNGRRRFRIKISVNKYSFYNLQFRIKTSSYFKLIAHGPNVEITRRRDASTMFKAA